MRVFTVLVALSLPLSSWASAVVAVVPTRASQTGMADVSRQALMPAIDSAWNPLISAPKITMILTIDPLGHASHAHAWAQRGLLLGLHLLMVSIFGRQNGDAPYWGARAMRPDELARIRPLYGKLERIYAHKKELLERLAAARLKLAREYPSFRMENVGLQYNGLPAGVTGIHELSNEGLSIDEKVKRTLNILNAHPELHAIREGTGATFWHALYQCDADALPAIHAIDAVTRPFNFVVPSPNKYSYEGFSATAVVGKIPADHFFRRLLKLRQADLVPPYHEPSEKILWAVIKASKKVDVTLLMWQLDGVEDTAIRRYHLLHALEPVILHMDEMPKVVREALQMLLNAGFYRLGSHEFSPMEDMPAADYLKRLQALIDYGDLSHSERLIMLGQQRSMARGMQMLNAEKSFDFLTTAIYQRLYDLWRAYYRIVSPLNVTGMINLEMNRANFDFFNIQKWLASLQAMINDLERWLSRFTMVDKRQAQAARMAIHELSNLHQEVREAA